MPKHATTGPPAGFPGPPFEPGPRSLRERVGAMRNIPPFVRLVWRTSPALTLAEGLVRLVRALIPVTPLSVGKLIIEEVLRLSQLPSPGATPREWLDSGLVDHLALLVAIELGLAIVADVLGRGVALLDSLLAEKFSNETRLRRMKRAATLDL